MNKFLWKIRNYFFDRMIKENKKNPKKCTWKSNLYCKLSGFFWNIVYKRTPPNEWCFDMFKENNND